MLEIKYISRTKRSYIKLYTLSNNEDSKRELRNIAINHSADIDYKKFVNIYRKCTSEPYSFLTIHKSFGFIIKRILFDELKFLDDKIKVNQTQYDLDREAAKISALSSKN